MNHPQDTPLPRLPFCPGPPSPGCSTSPGFTNTLSLRRSSSSSTQPGSAAIRARLHSLGVSASRALPSPVVQASGWVGRRVDRARRACVRGQARARNGNRPYLAPRVRFLLPPSPFSLTCFKVLSPLELAQATGCWQSPFPSSSPHFASPASQPDPPRHTTPRLACWLTPPFYSVFLRRLLAPAL